MPYVNHTLQLWVLLAACMGLAAGLTILIDASAEESLIPSWIKRSVAFWVNGDISDKEYLATIQWLIENDMIKIPADGASNAGTKYLKNESKFSMIQPSNWEKQVVYLDPLDNLPVYSMIETSTFEEAYPTTISVTIDYLGALSLEEYYALQWSMYADLLPLLGEVEFLESGIWDLHGKPLLWQVYTLDVGSGLFSPEYGLGTSKIKSIDIVIEHLDEVYLVSYTSAISNYDKDLEQFSDILMTMEFLSLAGSVPPPDQSSTPKTTKTPAERDISDESSRHDPPSTHGTICSGTASCLTGKVTRITDGDTIDLDHTPIRFALASAPELDTAEGHDAKDFIAQICPVGSSAVVDEDDGQTGGSYGRIIGVVYCNGANLNEELVKSGHGYISSRFCSSSEFSTHPWAQKFGCN